MVLIVMGWCLGEVISSNTSCWLASTARRLGPSHGRAVEPASPYRGVRALEVGRRPLGPTRCIEPPSRLAMGVSGSLGRLLRLLLGPSALGGGIRHSPYFRTWSSLAWPALLYRPFLWVLPQYVGLATRFHPQARL